MVEIKPWQRVALEFGSMVLLAVTGYATAWKFRRNW